VFSGSPVTANWMGTAFDVGYVVQGIALLIISPVMLRSTIFSKGITYPGSWWAQ
jgi:hypothetical protein